MKSTPTTTKTDKKKAHAPRARRAGLLFPVARVARYMKAGKYCPRIGAAAPVYVTAVLEYVVGEVMELAGKVAQSEGRSRIKPRHIQVGMRNDLEFIKLLGNATIGCGGVMPNFRHE